MSEFIAGFKEIMPSAHFVGNVVGGLCWVGMPMGFIIYLACWSTD